MKSILKYVVMMAIIVVITKLLLDQYNFNSWTNLKSSSPDLPKPTRPHITVHQDFIEKTIGDYGLEKRLSQELSYEVDDTKIYPKIPKTTKVLTLDQKDSSLVIFSVADLNDSELTNDFSGSAGSRTILFLIKNGQYKIALDDNFIDVLGYINTIDGNDLVMICHGGIFDRDGNDYGYCRYTLESFRFVMLPKELSESEFQISGKQIPK